MKALRRSLSPFRRRKTAKDLIQDVRLFEESLVSITPITPLSKAKKSAKSSVKTPDTSHESVEGSHTSTSSVPELREQQQQQQQQQRPRSRSPFRRRKETAELLDDVRQLETKSLIASAVHLSPTLRSEPGPPGPWRSSGTVSTASEPPHRPRHRSKSPIAQRKKASELMEDLRDFERSVNQSSSTVTLRYVPGQSCRTVCSSPNYSMSSTGSSALQNSSPASPSGSRSSSRSRFWRLNEETGSTGCILAAPWSLHHSRNGSNERGVEQELTPPPRHHVETLKPLHLPRTTMAHTHPPLRVPSSPGSVASSAAPRSRSKSPYIGRRKVQHVIADMRKIEMDYASRAISFSECSAVELFLPPSVVTESSPVRTVRQDAKSPTNRHEPKNPAKSHLPISTSGIQTAATVPRHNLGHRAEDPQKRNIVGRKSLLAHDSSGNNQSLNHEDQSKPKSVASTALTDLYLTAKPDRRALPRSKTYVGKISVVGSTYPVAAKVHTYKQPVAAGANAKARYPKEELSVLNEVPTMVPTTSISLGRRSHISDLSCPVPDSSVIRHRSMGNDSVAEIQKALSKVQADLQGAHVMGKKVSRVLVMKKLLEVAETIECQEDRLLVQRKLSRLNDTESPCSDSSTSTDFKHSYRRKMRTQTSRIVSDDISLSDDDDDDDDDTRDSLSSESSFSVWLAKQQETKGHWQRILDVMGLSYLWFNDDDLEQEWDDFVQESNTDDEDNIPSPPIIEKLGSMTESHVARSSKKQNGHTSPHSPTLLTNNSQRKIEIAEEEQMLRELEQMDDLMKPSQPKVDIRKGDATGDRLKRLGYEMKKENEEVETKRKIAVYERKAREAAEIKAREAVELKAMQVNLANSQKEKSRRSGGATTFEKSLHISQPQEERATPRIAKESTISSVRRSGPSLSLTRVPSWHRRRTAGTKKPMVEASAVTKAASTDIEDGALSMGSIESYQFKIQSKATFLDRRVAIEDEDKDAALEETGWTYTEKAVRRKNRKALEAAAAHHDKRRKGTVVRSKEDEERSDRVRRGRDRSTRPPVNRKA